MRHIALLACLWFLSCSNAIQRTAFPLLHDGKYDSEFPYKNCSQEIKTISEATAKIYSTTQYKIYYFDRKDGITINNVARLSLEKCRYVNFGDSPVAGSGVVISSTAQAVLLLTCSHVVFHKDTVFTFYKDAGETQSGYIRTMAVKIRERLLAAGYAEDGALELLANDPETDIALVGKKWSSSLTRTLPEFTYPIGKARELEWGSFVYMIGYPQGQLMVTKAIVSQPNRDQKAGYLLDGVFNRGFSGGIVLAVRDGVPNFEMVGIAFSTSGGPEAVITPSPDAEYDMQVPYDGELYVTSFNRINYGITFVVPSETIIDFLKNQKGRLRGSVFGADLDEFLNKIALYWH